MNQHGMDRGDVDEPVSMDVTGTEVAAATPRLVSTVIAWFVIIASVTWVANQQNDPAPAKNRLGEPTSDAQDVIMLIQARYLVAGAEFFQQEGDQFYAQAALLNQGTVEQRLRFIILANELADADEAASLLDDLDRRLVDSGTELTEEQAELRDILTRLIGDYANGKQAAPSVTNKERALLSESFGWFGDLALATRHGEDQAAHDAVMFAARRTFATIITALGTGCTLGFLGCLGLLILIVCLATGNLRGGIRIGESSHGGIYAETFAVWLLLFSLLTRLTILIPAGNSQLLIVSGAMFLSLTALAWPWFRGISWGDIRRDIGWTGGRQPLFEPAIGIGCYAMTMPFLAVGFLLTAILMVLSGITEGPAGPGNEFAPTGLPSHPIIEIVNGADLWGKLQLFLVAAVAAPVVEETMFRGVLYRHLRAASARWTFFVSFLFSTTVNSFIFAVIHPQGYVAVPALMGIAFGLTLAREWRGTLIPSMVAHGIHNGLLMTVLILAVGD